MRSHDDTEDETAQEWSPSPADSGYEEGNIGQQDVGATPPPVPPSDGGKAQ